MTFGKRVVVVAAFLTCIIGLGCILYPYVSDYLNALERAKVANLQQEVVESAPETDLSSWMDDACLYNERLVNSKVVVTDPFDPSTVPVTEADYVGVLNIAGDGVMGTVSIPCIDVTLPIYHGTDEDDLRRGVGHVQGTSLPVGGESAHCVLAGHTGLPAARMFDDLGKVKEGDYVFFTVLGNDFAYQVYKTEVVLPEDTSSLAIVSGEDTVTLVTCTPYGINSHRLLVHARRCEVPSWWADRNEQGSATPVASVPMRVTLPFLTGVGAAIGLVAFLLVRLFLVGRREEDEEQNTDGQGSEDAPEEGASV